MRNALIGRKGNQHMRTICAAAMIALLAGPAFAQQYGKITPAQSTPKSQQEIESDRAAEGAYEKSLRNIPDKPPADPWGNARSLNAPKAAAKPSTATKTGSRVN
jgi:hypothetical protein